MNSPTQHDAMKARLERLGSYLEQDPDNATLLRDHAGLATQARAFEIALTSLRHLDALGHTTPDDLALTVFCLRASNRTDEASALLERARSLAPEHLWLNIEQAGLSLQLHRFEEALAQLPPRIDNDPGLASLAAEYRIHALHHLGRIEEAIAFAQQELAVRTDDLRVKSSLCPVLFDSGDIDAAAELAQTVYQNVGIRYDILETLATVALRDGKPDDARRWSREALSQRQDDGRAWLMDGLINLRQGDLPAALEGLTKATELMPRHAGSHLALGWTYLLSQQPLRAEEAFRLGIEASPAFAEGYGSQAVAAFAQGRHEEAQQLARKARLLDPASPTAHYVSVLLNGGNAADVTALAEQLLKNWGAQPISVQIASMRPTSFTRH